MLVGGGVVEVRGVSQSVSLQFPRSQVQVDDDSSLIGSSGSFRRRFPPASYL